MEWKMFRSGSVDAKCWSLFTVFFTANFKAILSPCKWCDNTMLSLSNVYERMYSDPNVLLTTDGYEKKNKQILISISSTMCACVCIFLVVIVCICNFFWLSLTSKYSIDILLWFMWHYLVLSTVIQNMTWRDMTNPFFRCNLISWLLLMISIYPSI